MGKKGQADVYPRAREGKLLFVLNSTYQQTMHEHCVQYIQCFPPFLSFLLFLFLVKVSHSLHAVSFVPIAHCLQTGFSGFGLCFVLISISA